MKDNELKDMDKLLKELNPPEVKAGEHKKALKSAATYSFLAANNKRSTFPAFIKLGLAFVSVLMFAGIGYAILQSVDSQGSETVQTNTNDEQGINDSQMISEDQNSPGVVDELEEITNVCSSNFTYISTFENNQTQEYITAGSISFNVPDSLSASDNCINFQGEGYSIRVSAGQGFHGSLCHGGECVVDESYKATDYLESELESYFKGSNYGVNSQSDILMYEGIQGILDYEIPDAAIFLSVIAKPDQGDTEVEGYRVIPPELEQEMKEVVENIFESITISYEVQKEVQVRKFRGVAKSISYLSSEWVAAEKNDGESMRLENSEESIILIVDDWFVLGEGETDVLWHLDYLVDEQSGILNVGYHDGFDPMTTNCTEEDGWIDFVCSEGDQKLTITATTNLFADGQIYKDYKPVQIIYENTAWDGDDAKIAEIMKVIESIEFDAELLKAE